MNDRPSQDDRQIRFVMYSWVTITLLLATIVFLWLSLELSRVSAWIPQVVLSATLLFLLLQLGREFLEWKSATTSGKFGSSGDVKSMLPALSAIGTMILAVWLSGVAIGATLFCLVYLRWYADERWWVSIGLALGLGLGVQLLFNTLMRIDLYQGVVVWLLIT